MVSYSKFVSSYANYGSMISKYDAQSLEAAYDKLSGCLYNRFAPENVEVLSGRKKIVKVEVEDPRDGMEITIKKIYKVGKKLFVLCRHDLLICSCKPKGPLVHKVEIQVGEENPASFTVIPYIFNEMYNDIDDEGRHWITHESPYLHAILDAIEEDEYGFCTIL